eukprot:3645852-Lingulodinium_polyedra.AAC.1
MARVLRSRRRTPRCSMSRRASSKPGVALRAAVRGDSSTAQSARSSAALRTTAPVSSRTVETTVRK